MNGSIPIAFSASSKNYGSKRERIDIGAFLAFWQSESNIRCRLLTTGA
jgi:hypothetical protein